MSAFSGKSLDVGSKCISGCRSTSISSGLLSIDSVLHSLEGSNDFLFEFILLLSDLGNKLRVMTIMSSVLVSLSISEFPDKFLDVPKNLFTEFINSKLPSLSVSCNCSQSSIVVVA